MKRLFNLMNSIHLQLLIALPRNEEKYILNTFKYHEKTYSTVKGKRYSSLCEHIQFLVSIAGWLVTKIYIHYAFEQAPFKTDFVAMNQVSRKKTTISVKSIFTSL